MPDTVTQQQNTTKTATQDPNASTGTQEGNTNTTQTASQGDAGQKTEDPKPEGFDSWSKDQQDYFSKLRKENASWRVKFKEEQTRTTNLEERLGKFETGLKKLFGGEGDDLPPEEKISQLEGATETLNFENAVLKSALENGIGKDDYEFYSFLLNQRVQELKEGEELSEEAFNEVIDKVKARSIPAKTSTSVEGQTGDAQATPAPEGVSGDITLEQFAQMNTTDKSVLYQKNPQLYQSLFKQAKEKRLLI